LKQLCAWHLMQLRQHIDPYALRPANSSGWGSRDCGVPADASAIAGRAFADAGLFAAGAARAPAALSHSHLAGSGPKTQSLSFLKLTLLDTRCRPKRAVV
jgi:hypothetical protein